MARSKGLQSVFDSVVDAANRLCHGANGALYLAEGDLYRAAAMGAGPEQLEWERAHPHKPDPTTLTGRVVVTRALVHIPDVLADAQYSWPGQAVVGYRAMVGAPIFVDDELIGVLEVVRLEAEPFSEDQIRLLQTFADQVALAIVNARLFDAVERQRTELSRFVSPQVAQLMSSPEGHQLLAGHRALVTVSFCDLRGFTPFAETAAPEELLEVLHEYHALVGELIAAHGGTLEHFAGDGVMVFFNDPVPIDHHELEAIRMAIGLQERFSSLAAAWRKRGTELGLGIGMASGYATLGRIGYEGRYEYGALGPIPNLASRLSDHARPGQILINQRVFGVVEDQIEASPVGEIELKGFVRPVAAYEVRGLRAVEYAT
ncbi:MAG: adenylate/guanylate cyclase domain-containing protein [Candidatus Limnocylindrales bacterium]